MKKEAVMVVHLLPAREIAATEEEAGRETSVLLSRICAVSLVYRGQKRKA